MLNDSVEEPNPSNPKRRAYKRQKLKKQFTVRIDEDLARTVIARCDSEGLRFTDAIEDALWVWMQRKRVPEAALRLRFLCNVIPLRLQRWTLRSWAFLRQPFTDDPALETVRRMVEDVVWNFGEDPRFPGRLEQLGEMPGTKEEDRL